MARQSADNSSAFMAGPTKELVFDSLQMGLALLTRLQAGRNAVISPHSISSVLAMLYCGANGYTRHELETILRMSEDTIDRIVEGTGQLQGYRQNSDTRVSSSSGAYIANGLTVESDYSKHIVRLAAKVTFMDFIGQPEAAREQINAWIAEETGSLISDLLPPGVITRDTALVLANAVYFKGLWKKPFDAKHSFDGKFHVAPGKTVTAKMMNLSSTVPYAVDEQRRAQLLFLPYAGNGDLGMIVLLPFKGTSLDACLTQKFSSSALATAVAGMKLIEVDVVLPRFSVSSFVDVEEGLNAMGVKSLFSSGADMSRLCPSRPLWVSSCIHRAVIEVTEEGTEAAAWAGQIIQRCIKPKPAKFVCNRPFAITVWHKPTAAALFFGLIDDPTLAVVQ